MIDEYRRKEIYNIAFRFLIENDISTIPVRLEDICQKLNIKLVKLTDIIRNTGIPKEQIFGCWGNEDGVLLSYNDICRIAYNDEKPINRQRFTIMEEVSHKILGHNLDPRFNVFNQTYDSKTYKRYEEEARMCAGLTLCPPQYFYSYGYTMSQNLFKDIYNVSAPCAQTRIDIFCKFESEIKSSELYDRLPKITLDKTYLIERLFA